MRDVYFSMEQVLPGYQEISIVRTLSELKNSR